MTTQNGGYTDEDMSVLTDDERASLVSLDADDGDHQAETENTDAEKQGATSTDAAQAAQEKPAEEVKDEAVTASEEPSEKPASQQASAFPQFAAPKDAEASLATIRAEADKIDEAFDLGEITAAEHRAQNRALAEKEREIQNALLMAEMSEQARKQSYRSTVQSFLAVHPEYEPGGQKYHLLDAELRRRQDEAASAGRDPLDTGLLRQAHESLMALFGGGTTQATAEPGVQKQIETPQARRPIPPSLAGIPAADMQSVTEGALAGLARLSGEDFEAAFAKLSESQREQFLAQTN